MIKSDLYTENNMDPVSCSDVIQVVLDVAGSIPVVGDAAQAAVGEAVGKLGNAVLRAMPVLVPLMANLPDIFQKLKDSMPKGKNPAPKRAVTTAKAAKACSGMSKGKVQTGAKKSKSGGTKDLNREKANGKAVCVNGKCFTADTLVLTKSGLRPIKEICKGDDIYSRNEETGETGFQKVKEVFVTEAHTIYHIWLDGKEEVKTTAYHSFFVKDRGWVTAIQLREADLLETAEGTAGITGITKVRHDEPVDVYNFHVDEWSSYFVTENKIFVHNNEEHVEERNVDVTTGEGYGAGDPPVRIDGEWSDNDIKQALLGHSPRGLGNPDIHHGDQMPGASLHEIRPGDHRNNRALHPNKYNQGVTAEMRQSDRELHWWYRAREQGADQKFPDLIYDKK